MALGITLSVFVLLGIGLYVIKPKSPKPPSVINSIQGLESYLEQVVRSKHPPGLSIAVVKDGVLLYAKGFGFADGLAYTEATKDTVYHWWSMTKIPTAVAIMQLYEQGKLDIDTPVNHYLSFFNVTYKGSVIDDVTVRQLLNHSAGLSNAAPEIFTWLHQEGDPPVNQTELVIEKLPNYSNLLFMPGEKTKYSNFGYMLLGATVESVTDQTYEEYIQTNLLKPLDMEATNFIYTRSMEENEAIGSQHLVDMYSPFIPILKLGYIIREWDGLRMWFDRVYNDQTPPTGLIGPVTDVAKFMLAYLDEGGGILKKESVLHMNAVLDTLSDPAEPIRGLGWEAHLTENGRRYLTHSGGGPGFATIFRIYPEEHLGVVVMGNDSTIDRDLLADILANMDW